MTFRKDAEGTYEVKTMQVTSGIKLDMSAKVRGWLLTAASLLCSKTAMAAGPGSVWGTGCCVPGTLTSRASRRQSLGERC